MGAELEILSSTATEYSSAASTATTESGAGRVPTAAALPAVTSRPPTSSSSSSRFKGVVPQPNGRWGAQIYERHSRVWLGTFPDEPSAARAYDVAALRYRGRDAATNSAAASVSGAELAFLAAHSKAEIVDMLRKHTYADELRQGLLRGHAGHGAGARVRTPAWAREVLFEKAVTPSDVGKLNRLVVPKQHAEKHFPLKRRASQQDPPPPEPEKTKTTPSGSGNKGVLLNFEDGEGKVWRFRYSYWNSSQSYVLTKGWSRFVREKGLGAGDAIVFSCSSAYGEKQFFIDCKKNGKLVSMPTSASRCASATKEEAPKGGEEEEEEGRVVRLFGVDIGAGKKRSAAAEQQGGGIKRQCVPAHRQQQSPALGAFVCL